MSQTILPLLTRGQSAVDKYVEGKEEDLHTKSVIAERIRTTSRNTKFETERRQAKELASKYKNASTRPCESKRERDNSDCKAPNTGCISTRKRSWDQHLESKKSSKYHFKSEGQGSDDARLERSRARSSHNNDRCDTNSNREEPVKHRSGRAQKKLPKFICQKGSKPPSKECLEGSHLETAEYIISFAKQPKTKKNKSK